MKKLNKAVIIISKIIEVASWVGVATAVVMCFLIGIRGTSVSKLFVEELGSGILTDMSSGGFTIYPIDSTDINLCFKCLMTLFISIFFISFNTAMIFRNIFLIFKTSEGKTKFAEGVTPFQRPVIRMVREIGIFCIGIPVSLS